MGQSLPPAQLLGQTLRVVFVGAAILVVLGAPARLGQLLGVHQLAEVFLGVGLLGEVLPAGHKILVNSELGLVHRPLLLDKQLLRVAAGGRWLLFPNGGISEAVISVHAVLFLRGGLFIVLVEVLFGVH